MKVQVQAISRNEYETELKERKLTHYFLQSPCQADLKQADGNPVFFYRLLDENANFCGLALLVSYRYKKIFYTADCLLGPILQQANPELLLHSVQALKNEVFRNPRIRVFRLMPACLLGQGSTLAPLQAPDFRPHVVGTRTDNWKSFFQAFSGIGFQDCAVEWYQNPSLLPRIFYKKKLGKNLEETLQSLNPTLRNRMLKGLRQGITVHFQREEAVPEYCRMLESTFARKNTLAQVEEKKYRKMLHFFGEDCFLAFARLKKTVFMASLEKEKEDLLLQQQLLREKFQKNPTSRRALGQQKNWDVAWQGLDQLRKRGETLFKDQEEVVLNAGLFFHSGDQMIYYSGAGYAATMFLNGAPVLHHQILNYAHQLGCKSYNLFGCSGLPNEQNPVDASVQKFKQTFHGVFQENPGLLICKKPCSFYKMPLRLAHTYPEKEKFNEPNDF